MGGGFLFRGGGGRRGRGKVWGVGGLFVRIMGCGVRAGVPSAQRGAGRGWVACGEDLLSGPPVSYTYITGRRVRQRSNGVNHEHQAICPQRFE